MNIIDFEDKFAAYMRAEVRAGRADPQKLAGNIEDIYAAWEKTPQDFLSGKTPANFFADMGAEEATAQLGGYFSAGLTPPQGLFARLQRLGHVQMEREKLASALFAALQNENAPEELRDYAATSLAHMRYLPAIAYFRAQILANPEHPLANGWHHALRQMDDAHALAHWALDAYPDAPRASQRRLLDFFADHGGDLVLHYALSFFEQENDDSQLPYAAHILMTAASIGDPDVIQALYARLEEDIGYISYREICHAVEALGGEIPDIEPDFTNDDDYRYLADMKDDV